MPTWQQAFAYPHPNQAQPGKAGVGSAWQGTHGTAPRHILVRPLNKSKRPVPLRTFTRVGADDGLMLASALITDLGGTVEGLDIGYRKTGVIGRYWYTRNAVLATVAALLAWSATVTAAVLAYGRFVHDGTSQHGSGWLYVLAAVVLGLAASSASVKLIIDVRQARG
jgi:hypothetical protein